MPYYGNNYSGGGNGGGGFNLRWIIAIVIALGGVISYYMKTSVNPVTGEKQHVALDANQEMQLGLQSAPRMAAQMGGEASPNDPMQKLITEVGMRVLHNSDAATGPYTDNFHYRLLTDDKTINAFALPGGQVFITRALLVRLENEAELAGVLGHETGHVIGRHTSEQLAKSQLGQSLVTAVAVGSSDRRGGGYSAAIIAGTVNQMLSLHYSRDDETEADTFGLKYMTQAGYDPRAMLGVMKVLQQVSQSRGQPPEMLQTHPYPEHRIETINAWIKQTFPNGVPANLTPGRRLKFTAEGQ
jgi:beta-barrel assembly-enhancing protease